MFVSLLKVCAATPILMKISFSILLSADMKLPRYMKSFTSSSSSTLPLTVFLVLCLQFHEFGLLGLS